MLRSALRRALEGYRWLWQAQRRWKPGAFWLACVQFSARVTADIMRSMRPRGSTSAAVAIAAGTVAVVIGINIARNRAPDVQPTPWRHQAGGFAVAFPAPWESASEDDVLTVRPLGEPIPGSAYRRAAGGLLFPRFVTAQTYALGEITSIRDAARSLTERLVGPVESLARSEIASPAVRVAAYRFEDGGEPLTQAAVVFRALNADGYMIGLTGRREDEAIVLAAARQIADSIRYDGEPMTDGEIGTAELWQIPLEAWLAARTTAPTVGEARDSATWRIVPVTVNEATSSEECRAAAIMFAESSGRAPAGVFRTGTDVACASSRIAIRRDTGRIEFRQFDRSGNLAYETTIALGLTNAERYWIVNGQRFDVRNATVYAGPIVRVRIGS